MLFGRPVFDIVAHSGVMMSVFPLVSYYCHAWEQTQIIVVISSPRSSTEQEVTAV